MTYSDASSTVPGAAISKNTSVTIGEHFDRFIAERIKQGRHGSASEVIRAGLCLLEAKEARIDALCFMLVEGEKSGFSDYTCEKLIQELDETH